MNRTATAVSPGKIILFGEHAINRGEPAIAAAVGLYAWCRVSASDRYEFVSGSKRSTISRPELLQFKERVDGYRRDQDFESIRRLAKENYFAPQQYVLGSVLVSSWGERLPDGLRIEWESDLPSGSGLGSGGSAFTAMIAALANCLEEPVPLAQRAALAQLGDVIAHGGVASGLDTQTALLGGVILYRGDGLAEPVPCSGELPIVIAHTGVTAATSEVNSRVRQWLGERQTLRMHEFRAIGALVRASLPVLRERNWDELGRLMNLNQLVLEKIGVSCPEIDRLVRAALEAGAYGAKISGSGGGGIIIVLVSEAQRESIIAALKAAGGAVLTPRIGVAGVCSGGPEREAKLKEATTH